MKDFFYQILKDDFFPAVSPDDRKSNLVLYAWIFPLLVFIIYMDFATHDAKISWHFVLVKSVLLLSVIVSFIYTYLEKYINIWPVVLSFYMLTYSVYGVFYIDFSYCYSFLELYLAMSIFFRFSKKTYLLLMLWGGILNFFTIEYMREPNFIKEGMSFKPHMLLMSIIIYYLSMMLFYFVTKKREELSALHAKYALIGKQSSFAFHEIKKPMRRLISAENNENSDFQLINNILFNIELMFNNPQSFKESFKTFNFKRVFTRLEEEFIPFFNEYNIEFHYPKKDLPLVANEGLIFQVFKNLMVNAIEAIAKNKNNGEDTRYFIQVDVEEHTNEGKTILRFSNTGSSIAKIDRENIFNPFYSTKNTTANNGLGLSFCRNIIEGHGGSITAHSEKDAAVFILVI